MKISELLFNLKADQIYLQAAIRAVERITVDLEALERISFNIQESGLRNFEAQRAERRIPDKTDHEESGANSPKRRGRPRGSRNRPKQLTMNAGG
jgi:hypothetical protein